MRKTPAASLPSSPCSCSRSGRARCDILAEEEYIASSARYVTSTSPSPPLYSGYFFCRFSPAIKYDVRACFWRLWHLTGQSVTRPRTGARSTRFGGRVALYQSAAHRTVRHQTSPSSMSGGTATTAAVSQTHRHGRAKTNKQERRVCSVTEMQAKHALNYDDYCSRKTDRVLRQLL